VRNDSEKELLFAMKSPHRGKVNLVLLICDDYKHTSFTPLTSKGNLQDLLNELVDREIAVSVIHASI
jgi:hypothetical protein